MKQWRNRSTLSEKKDMGRVNSAPNNISRKVTIRVTMRGNNTCGVTSAKSRARQFFACFIQSAFYPPPSLACSLRGWENRGMSESITEQLNCSQQGILVQGQVIEPGQTKIPFCVQPHE